jgi:hypothetical protein
MPAGADWRSQRLWIRMKARMRFNLNAVFFNPRLNSNLQRVAGLLFEVVTTVVGAATR